LPVLRGWPIASTERGLGRGDDELAEFNRLAGTKIPLADFQGIYKSEDPEDFVRRILFQRFLTPNPQLLHAEMVEIVWA
jgi:hypothetical protein